MSKNIDKEKERLELAKFMIKSSNKNGTNLLNPDGTIYCKQGNEDI